MTIDGRDAERLDEIELAGRAGAVHGQLHVERVNELGDGRADATGNGTDQDARAGRERDARTAEHAVGSHVVERQGGNLDWVIGRLELDELGRGQDDVRRVRAVQTHAGDEIAGAETRDVHTDGVDVAGEVIAEGEAGLLDALVRIAACALDVVGAGDARGQDLDPDFTGAWLRQLIPGLPFQD